jgi:hypothetical protein
MLCHAVSLNFTHDFPTGDQVEVFAIVHPPVLECEGHGPEPGPVDLVVYPSWRGIHHRIDITPLLADEILEDLEFHAKLAALDGKGSPVSAEAMSLA